MYVLVLAYLHSGSVLLYVSLVATNAKYFKTIFRKKCAIHFDKSVHPSRRKKEVTACLAFSTNFKVTLLFNMGLFCLIPQMLGYTFHFLISLAVCTHFHIQCMHLFSKTIALPAYTFTLTYTNSNIYNIKS